MEVAPIFDVFLRVDGPDFDPEAFHVQFGASLGGTVAATRTRQYWRSEVVRVSDDEHADQALLALLERLRPALIAVVTPGVRVVAQIVQRYDDAESVRGLFFPPELVRELGQLGIGVDFDIVPIVR